MAKKKTEGEMMTEEGDVLTASGDLEAPKVTPTMVTPTKPEVHDASLEGALAQRVELLEKKLNFVAALALTGPQAQSFREAFPDK